MMPATPDPTRTNTMPSPAPLSHRLRVLIVAGGASAALLAAAAPSSAAETTTKASGTTTIKLSAAVKSAMKKGKVTLGGIAPGKRGATTVKLPLGSATIDPDTGSGTLNHTGGVRFKRGGRTIALKAFRVAVAPESSSISVAIGSSRVRMFDVDTSDVKIAQTAKRLTLGNLDVKLTSVGASRLNRALKVSRFRSGMSVGVASAAIATPGAAAPAGSTVLKSGTTTLTLTPEAKAGLAQSGATIGTNAPATGSGSGPYAFPITGGALDASKAFAGSATHSGALVLTAQGQSLTLQDPVVDLAASQVTAVVNGTRVEAFSLDLSTLRHVRYDGQLVLDGIVVKRAKSGPLSDPSGAPSGVIGTLRLDAKTD
jgi:hypothetical protein